MAFIEDIIFPENISKGSRGGPGFRHNVFVSDTGEQHAISRWPRERRMWNARWGVRQFEHLRTVHDLYLAVRGLSNGFRWVDPFDKTTAVDGLSAPSGQDAVLGTGDGSNVVFQLLKAYQVSSTVHQRTLEKPIQGSLVVEVDGTPQTEGVDFTADYSTGSLLFSTAPAIGEPVTAGCAFHVPVQFGQALDSMLEISIDGWQHGQIPDIPIVEMVGNVATPDQPYRGGGSTQVINIDTAYDYSFGHSVSWVPGAAGLFVMMPEIIDLPGGPEIFHFHNASGTNSLDFRKREDGTLAFTLAPNTGAIVGVRVTASLKEWIAFGATVTT